MAQAAWYEVRHITMGEAISVALITGGLSMEGAVITCFAASKNTEQSTAVAQAITEAKMSELTREV